MHTHCYCMSFLSLSFMLFINERLCHVNFCTLLSFSPVIARKKHCTLAILLRFIRKIVILVRILEITSENFVTKWLPVMIFCFSFTLRSMNAFAVILEHKHMLPNGLCTFIPCTSIHNDIHLKDAFYPYGSACWGNTRRQCYICAFFHLLITSESKEVHVNSAVAIWTYKNYILYIRILR